MIQLWNGLVLPIILHQSLDRTTEIRNWSTAKNIYSKNTKIRLLGEALKVKTLLGEENERKIHQSRVEIAKRPSTKHSWKNNLIRWKTGFNILPHPTYKGKRSQSSDFQTALTTSCHRLVPVPGKTKHSLADLPGPSEARNNSKGEVK